MIESIVNKTPNCFSMCDNLKIIKIEENILSPKAIAVYYNEIRIGFLNNRVIICKKAIEMMKLKVPYGIEWALLPFNILNEIDINNIRSNNNGD